jgi:hypothetical protein
MNKPFSLLLSAVVLAAAISSCGSSGNDAPSTTYTPTPVHFQQGKIAYYDLNIVDTADASGNNLDRIIPDPDNPAMVEEIVADTNVTTFANVSRATKTILASNPSDTNYYYQDKDGFLWRYNYGFSKLNNYTFLVLALGRPVDVGWVLVGKPGAPAGTTWVAKKDSMMSPQYGKMYLDDNATAMADTTFKVSNGSGVVDVKAIHVRHIVNGHTAGNEVSGVIAVDFYYAPELGLTMRDLFHSSKLTGLNLKTRGSEKIIVSFKP